jgi:RNA 3'-terminal phosphate cyclase (ATP)
VSPLEVDAADGGGQLLRTAVTLSCLTERPVELTGIRTARPNPGLRPQHVACVAAARQLTDAAVEGCEAGSERLTFAPNHPPRGDVSVDVGTAGSVTLVFDTVYPLAVGLDDPISVTVSGGTDVRWAPTFDWYRGVKLPLLARVGLAVDATLERRGFHPAGGGRATLTGAPSSLQPLAFDERGDLVATVHAVASAGLAEADVCSRAVDRVRERLSCPVAETTTAYADTDSPGFVLTVALAGESRAGFDVLGERGVPAEEIADRVVDDAHAWLDGDGVVDAHLADQLVVPLALAGGVVRIPRTTAHVRTNLGLVEQFGVEIERRERDGSVVLSGAGMELFGQGA